MKKLLAMVLALVMTLSLAVSASAFKDDKDVSADYAEAVAVLDGMGVFKGYEDGSFKPTGDITRAEVATIIYRIYTGDVAKNDKSGLYSTYNKFSDMTGAGWAAGYIGYCANAELVKGYPDGTFKPSGNVTGYEVLAMILRAVGYDKNGEFSGADWSLNVAKYAEQLGVLKNVAKTTNLGAPATRELVAEILFRAIQQPMVTYTPAFGYVTDKVQKLDQTSLGYKNFKLVSGDGTDDWGRPTTIWAKDANANAKYDAKDTTEYATIVATPDAAFHVATTECDICEALGIKKSDKIAEIYDNGKLTKDTDTLTATETKATLGDQGQQIEFYELKDGGYRMVIIDTYLAKVDSVKTEKTDAKGHVTSDAYMELSVYTKAAATDGKTYYVKGNDYAKGDYILVNVNDEADNNVTIVSFAKKQPLVEIVGKADSLDAAQTKIWKNADKHTIADKDYMDAVQLNHNEAGDSTVKFTWLFDQFGNLIGSVALDRSNYAVLKDIIWEVGRPGYAEATLISMVDGEEYKATVDTIDGFKAGWTVADDNTDPTHSSTKRTDFGFIGEDSTDNEYYLGLAMYRVDTNDDGTVQLQGISTKDDKKAELDETYVKYATKASIEVKTSAILDKDGKELGSLTKSTNFIVRTEDAKDNNVYTLYTGTKELPAMQEKSVSVFYVDSDKDGFVDFVYVEDFVSDTLAPSYFFAYDESAKRDPDTAVWTVNVYLNGEKTDIEIKNSDYTNLVLGKLYVATFDKTTGYVDTLTPVTESNDNTPVSPNKDVSIKDTSVDYLTGTVSISGGTIKNIETATKTYTNADDESVKFVSYNDDYASLADLAGLSSKELAKLGIWVVADKDGAYTQATAIYVGKKLTSDAEEAAAAITTAGSDRNNYGDLTVAVAEGSDLSAEVLEKVNAKLEAAGYTDVTASINNAATYPVNAPASGSSNVETWFEIKLVDATGESAIVGSNVIFITNNYNDATKTAAVEKTIREIKTVTANMSQDEVEAAVTAALTGYNTSKATVTVTLPTAGMTAGQYVNVTVTGTVDGFTVNANANLTVKATA